jgi:peptidoglycan/LPS O-acetylase OafA/YrhL
VFARRRAARIVPLALAALALFLVLAAAGLVRAGSVTGIVVSALLVQPWVPVQSIYFGGIQVAWSLADEAFFYAAFPFLIGPLDRMGGRRRSLVAAGGIAVLLALVTFFWATGTHVQLGYWLTYVFPPVRLAEFVLGVVLALELRDGRLPAVPVGVAVTLAVAGYLAAGFVPVWFTWSATTVLPYALLIVALAQLDLRGGPSLLRDRRLLALGAWSFALYLVHLMVLESIKTLLDGEVAGVRGVAAGVAVVAVSVPLAAALFTLVEKPLERRLRGDRTLSAASAADA